MARSRLKKIDIEELGDSEDPEDAAVRCTYEFSVAKPVKATV